MTGHGRVYDRLASTPCLPVFFTGSGLRPLRQMLGSLLPCSLSVAPFFLIIICSQCPFAPVIHLTSSCSLLVPCLHYNVFVSFFNLYKVVLSFMLHLSLRSSFPPQFLGLYFLFFSSLFPSPFPLLSYISRSLVPSPQQLHPILAFFLLCLSFHSTTLCPPPQLFSLVSAFSSASFTFSLALQPPSIPASSSIFLTHISLFLLPLHHFSILSSLSLMPLHSSTSPLPSTLCPPPLPLLLTREAAKRDNKPRYLGIAGTHTGGGT